MRPIDVTPSNAQQLWDTVYHDYLSVRKKTPALLAGDKVRVARAKNIFEKGYFPNFSDHIYKVDKVSKEEPNFFLLKNYEVNFFLIKIDFLF